ncbi:methylenetetrahydrofolate reductase [Sphingomonas sp. MMS24-J45]|uniref:methylenetetrahydrofolate reductase n=1 Tax=Sphingomonas sp. MMS24-J45 TaxID=3238806 RepID=UPI003850F9FF
MGVAAIHPAWEVAPAFITEGYSLEMTAKDRDALTKAAPHIAPDTPIAITFLPGETMDARIAAACHVRASGFEPMPHLSARRIASQDELAEMVERLTVEAGAKRMFIVAGDPPVPAGPFADTLSVLRTGLMETHGIKAIGIAGHPDGHPALDSDGLWQALDDKCSEISARGMAPLIVTQFGFDADPFLRWLTDLRARGIAAPVRIGVPGPAGIKTLLRFAAHCGVGASAAVMTKYGVSITKLLGTAGPDALVDALAAGIGAEHGPIRLHFYPFGGLERTVAWINDYSAANGARA